jgi:uncharacterized DUF497 family protein
MSLRFQWDPQKAARNARKHGVTFVEAVTVFQDLLAYIFDDEEHSGEKHRELIIGYSSRNRLLIVSFTERDGTVRIITARKADAYERDDYERAKH